MQKIDYEIKQGIKAHFIKTNRFKTNMVSIIITVPLLRETVTKNALIVSLLRCGSANLKTQIEINRALELLYGAQFECGVDKYGDNQILKFYLDTINDKYTLNNEKVLCDSIRILLDIIFNPVLENGLFLEKYLNIEKDNLEKIINSKIDEKGYFAYEDCISKMYDEHGFGLYKYGYSEDLAEINAKDLTEYYKNLIQNCKIDMFISGDYDENEVIKEIIENDNIQKLRPRIENYILNNEYTEIKNPVEEERQIVRKMDVNQGKLVIGIDVLSNTENVQYKTLLYNTILGGSANSLLFQNVREKESLAYAIKSVYVKQKANIFIRAGIEIDNYNKALELIKAQIEMMKNGEFTDEDISSAKEYIKSGINSIDAEQDSGIVYFIGQEIAKTNVTVEEYTKIIESISREDIIEIAKNIQLNIVYFLRN